MIKKLIKRWLKSDTSRSEPCLDRAAADRPYVFGIGLPKTGTTTLGACLTHLGYRVKDFDLTALQAYTAGDIDSALQGLSGYNACEDAPWFMLYRELDARFPNSLFILTERLDANSWLRSALGHRDRMKGNPIAAFASEVLVNYFDRQGIRSDDPLQMHSHHGQVIREYFKGRESVFRVLNWEAGDSWPELCAFIGVPVPNNIPFPHENAAPRPHPQGSA